MYRPKASGRLPLDSSQVCVCTYINILALVYYLLYIQYKQGPFLPIPLWTGSVPPPPPWHTPVPFDRAYLPLLYLDRSTLPMAGSFLPLLLSLPCSILLLLPLDRCHSIPASLGQVPFYPLTGSIPSLLPMTELSHPCSSWQG
jgi:hypothetical protein